MAVFKVLKPYQDIQLDKKLKVNEEVEMTVKRSKEVESILSSKGFEVPFLERIDKK